MLRLVRRPLIPGEFDAERWVPPLFLGGGLIAWGFFTMGWTSPGCLFRRLTDFPCLACGGTRCVRALTQGDIIAALSYNPAVTLGVLTLAAWMFWSLLAKLRGDPLRVRLDWDRAGGIRLRWMLAFALLLHWIWLAWQLPR